jgi:hypothetical protein
MEVSMVKAFRILAAFAVLAATAAAADVEIATSRLARNDVPVNSDPRSPFWASAPVIVADKDKNGNALSDYRTEVRSRWTREYLYFLFVCPYQELFLKPKPATKTETNQLWNWDVAEVFLGSDFQNIRRYKEFEISPQGEWIDLDIDLAKPHHEDGWTWNSGFQVTARIDHKKKIWYGTMKIPWSALGETSPEAGKTFRVNFFRSQGPTVTRKDIAWQPTMSETFHVPERFGLLKLAADH